MKNTKNLKYSSYEMLESWVNDNKILLKINMTYLLENHQVIKQES